AEAAESGEAKGPGQKEKVKALNAPASIIMDDLQRCLTWLSITTCSSISVSPTSGKWTGSNISRTYEIGQHLPDWKGW
ncbi:MAG: hypothetical protein WCB50_05805, partial [Pseudolabrys sp.]